MFELIVENLLTKKTPGPYSFIEEILLNNKK